MKSECLERILGDLEDRNSKWLKKFDFYAALISLFKFQIFLYLSRLVSLNYLFTFSSATWTMVIRSCDDWIAQGSYLNTWIDDCNYWSTPCGRMASFQSGLFLCINSGLEAFCFFMSPVWSNFLCFLIVFFLADDIHLDRVNTIKVVGNGDTINGLEFIVPDNEAWISDRWRRGSHKLGIFM